MAALTYAQVYALARGTGLSQQQAIVATAIAGAETNGPSVGLPMDPTKLGDTGITTATWGPSVGLWQIRTLKAETGTGRSRDINILTDPVQNARAMFEISSGGNNWGPWSTYGDGKYRAHMAAATAAAAGDSGKPIAPKPTPTYPAGNTVTVADGKSPFDVDLNLGPLGRPVEGLVKAAGPILLGTLVVTAGVALVVVGLWKATK
ncbi:MAG: hypothetical protein HOV96_19625 [Nonomuraea sp.]|nr:hypothetical protein [Nonomuraea sp.]